jgi:hypothetical protein
MKKKTSMQNKAEIALKQAVSEVIEKHKISGRPLSVWSNGRIVHVSPRSLK